MKIFKAKFVIFMLSVSASIASAAEPTCHMVVGHKNRHGLARGCTVAVSGYPARTYPISYDEYGSSGGVLLKDCHDGNKGLCARYLHDLGLQN